MGKLIRIVLGGGVLLLVGAAVLVWFVLSNLDAIVKRTVERVGSETTGTAVTLDGARVSIKSTEGALDGLTIANPPGFESPNAFELDEIVLDLDVATIRSEEIVVREVTVKGAHVTFEQKGDTNNLQTLLDRVEQAATDGSADGSDGEEARMVIESFTLTGGRMTLIHDRLDRELSFEISDVTVRDIGRVGAGETASAVARQLMDPVLRRAMSSAQDQARGMLEERLQQEVDERKDQAVESLKKKLLGND